MRFAIADAHTDYRRSLAMAAAHIIESAPERADDARWTAGHAILVTTGHIIDKGRRV
jgi:acyl-CoA thioesterase FadM